MEQRNNLVLQGTETFSRGALDNVALEDGCLVLDSVAGRSLPYGSYTTPEFAMPAFCNLNVSWNAHAPHNTLVEVRCRVYAGGVWTGWLSFGKWAPDYPRCSVQAQSDDRLIFLMGDTVTVATPGGATGVQLQVNLSTNRQEGRVLNRQLYLPEYCLSAHDPTFGHEMDLPLVLAALMNRYGEDILPEEVAYAMEDHATRSTGNTAFAAAAAGCCGYPCWQAWMDLADLRTQIHDGCSVAVQLERRSRTQREPASIWMGLRGFGHDAAVLADYVLLNDPTAESNGAVGRTMALADFMRDFTGRALVLRAKLRGIAADRPLRIRCEIAYDEADQCWYFSRRGSRDPLPEEFSGWAAAALLDGVAHATTAHRVFRRAERTRTGGLLICPEQLDRGGPCSVYAVDQTGAMRVAELHLPKPAPAAEPAPPCEPSSPADVG